MAKQGYKRAERVADQIRMEIADILLRKTKDSRLHAVTVTDVELTADLRLARVYVTTMRQGEAEQVVMSGLQRAAGFIRGELGKRLSLRYSPSLEFHQDTSGPRGDRILSLLEGLRREGGSDVARGETAQERGAGRKEDGLEG